MGRSVKKGPFTDTHLEAKLAVLSTTSEKKVVRTWSRRSTILPEFVGHTVAVHNGKQGRPVHARDRGPPPSCRSSSVTPWRATTARNSSRCTSPKTWWDTSWASFRPPGCSKAIREKRSEERR